MIMSKMENGDDFNITVYLMKKKWRCVDFQLRVLEDQLENLGSQMNCVAKASLLKSWLGGQVHNNNNNNNINNIDNYNYNRKGFQ